MVTVSNSSRFSRNASPLPRTRALTVSGFTNASQPLHEFCTPLPYNGGNKIHCAPDGSPEPVEGGGAHESHE